MNCTQNDDDDDKEEDEEMEDNDMLSQEWPWSFRLVGWMKKFHPNRGILVPSRMKLMNYPVH